MPNLKLYRSSTTLLHTMLDEPRLPAMVANASAATLHGLIKEVGLEDCGEIVAMASVEQLEELFDLDLWSNVQPGDGETLDSARMFTWFDIILEAGEERAARIIGELDRDLLVHVMGEAVLVIETQYILQWVADRTLAEALNKAMENSLGEELSDYQLFSMAPEVWDTALAVLLSLHDHCHDDLLNVLGNCSAISLARFTEGEDLLEALNDADTLFEDLGARREERMAKSGHVSPRDARAFLKLAETSGEEILDGAEDAITGAYFRGFNPGSSLTWSFDTVKPAAHLPPAIATLLDDDFQQSEGSLEQSFMAALLSMREESPETFSRRTSELAYLSNVLQAGASKDGRRYRPLEAIGDAVGACTRGLSRIGVRPESFSEKMVETPLPRLFLLGWK